MTGHEAKRQLTGTPPFLIPLFISALCATLASPYAFFSLLETYLTDAWVMLCLGLIILLTKIILRRPYSREWAIQRFRKGLWPLSLVTLAFCIGMSAFTTLKLSIPKVVPFYMDPYLAEAGRWLHGGYPGEILHNVFPDWIAWPVAILYGGVWFTLWAGIITFVALHEDQALRRRYFWSMLVSYSLIGIVLATAFSSVGPIYYETFYGNDRYAGLISSLRNTEVWPQLVDIANYLYQNYTSGGMGFGTGISAMPSMHVAVVTLNAWMLSSISRIAGVFAWFYVVAILFGSVYLGWHYVLDGYCSILLVSLIWWASARLLNNAVTLPSRRDAFGVTTALP